MALSDGPATPQHLIAANIHAQAHMARLKQEREAAEAKTSEERNFVADDGTMWKYVVIGGEEVRIESCEPADGVTHIDIPANIEGLPVTILASDVCSNKQGIVEIVCPDSIYEIGPCAFRLNNDLESIVFPANVSNFDSHWFRSCRKLQHIKMPGQLKKIVPSMFDMSDLKSIVIGEGTQEIEPGAFAKSKLEKISIVPENPDLITDGIAVYTTNWENMCALALPVEQYTIHVGCKRLDRKAFSNMECVKKIYFNDDLEVIGEFACSRTSIEEFVAPESLREILEKAFYNCTHLQKVVLDCNLEVVEQNAFSDTKIEELSLPKTIKSIGNPLASGTDLTYSGADATFSIPDDANYLMLDGDGGLYEKSPEGLVFIRMMDPEIRDYRVQPTTIKVEPGAFENHQHIESIQLPESVLEIGNAAFRGCKQLKSINLPDHLSTLGNEALQDTQITTLSIPAALTTIGDQAFVTYGAHHGNCDPSLESIYVAPENERFYAHDGMLLERKTDGKSKLVTVTNNVSTLHIPEEVDQICDYAMNSITNIRDLYISDRVTTVGARGLTVGAFLDLIHIDLDTPVEGHTYFDVRFPRTDRGAQQMMLSLGTSQFVNVEAIIDHYDTAIVNSSSFDSFGDAGLDLYTQAKLVIERLKDPVYLSSVNKGLAEHVLENHIEEISVEAAKHNDRDIFDELVNLGFINEDNIMNIIERVGAVQDALMTGYLLEIQRKHFNKSHMDTMIDLESDFEL